MQKVEPALYGVFLSPKFSYLLDLEKGKWSCQKHVFIKLGVSKVLGLFMNNEEKEGKAYRTKNKISEANKHEQDRQENNS